MLLVYVSISHVSKMRLQKQQLTEIHPNQWSKQKKQTKKSYREGRRLKNRKLS